MKIRMRRTLTYIVVILLFGSLGTVIGCGVSNPIQESSIPTVSSSLLPTPSVTQFDSPLLPTEIPGPTFAIDRPLRSGATHLTGQGPAGIPIVVVDVTLTGQEIGQGFIGEDGRFDIVVSPALIAGHRIGLMAGATHQMSPEETQIYLRQLLRWKGEGARDMPFIGLLFDTALVQ